MLRIFVPEDGAQGGSLSSGTVCCAGARKMYVCDLVWGHCHKRLVGSTFRYFSWPQITRRVLSRDAARNRSLFLIDLYNPRGKFSSRYSGKCNKAAGPVNNVQ